MFGVSLLALISIVPLTYCVSEAELYSEPLHRSKRQLLFPNSTLLQFNAGLGTPSPVKNVNVNFAFQANFQLPWNRSQIPLDILEANSGYDGESRKKRDSERYYENDGRLYHFYKYLEEVLNGFGYNGTACVKRTLCQLGSEPLHTDDEEDLLHELAIFVLNPQNDLAHHPSQEEEISPYKEAYNFGQNSQNCLHTYPECSGSFIDVFTKLHDPS